MFDASGKYDLFYEGGSMMSHLANYVLSVIAASVIVAIICTLLRNHGGVTSIIKLVCGLFLTFVVINPLIKLDFSGINDYLDSFTLEGLEAASVGENMAREGERDIIISRVQAYILDKADSFGAQLNVEVVLDQDNIPVSVELNGNISPYAKAQMADILARDLGITKEHQLWIG